MATTILSNIIEPKVFTAYSNQQTALKSALISSGILAQSDLFTARVNEGGATFEVPHFNPFAWSESNVQSDNPSTLSTPNNITTGSQIGQKDFRGKDWGAMDLVSVISGENVMEAISNIVSTYWVQDYQQLLLAKLKGIELDNAANDSGDMIVNIANDANSAPTAAQSANVSSFLDTFQTMGDAAGSLGVIIMHSQIYTNLMKLEPTSFATQSGTVPFTTYLGKRVIIDDTMPVVAGTYRKTYTTYVLKPGAFAFAEANVDNATEVWRNPAAGNGSGEERLYSRKQLLLHPIGFKSQAAITSRYKSPTITQYADATAFDRVYDRKNIGIALLKTNA